VTSRKLIVLTALVVVLFAFVFFFERRMPSTSERQQKGDLVWEIPEEKIETVRLERASGVVELTRTGEKTWRLVKPDSYPADGFAASDLVSQLARLRRTGEDSTEAKPEDYGLKSPAAKATILWKDDARGKKLSRTLEVGIDIPGTDSTAARAAGGNVVLFVPSSLALAVKKTPDEFKSREVFASPSSDTARLDVDRGRGRLSLARKDGVWWLRQPLVDLADNDAVGKLISALTALRVIDFLPSPQGQGLAALGLAPPLFHVAGSDAKGQGASVDFGATKSDGNAVYGRRESQVFTVASTIVEDLSKETEAFREPRLIRFDRGSVSSIEGAFARSKFLLERKQEGWSLGGKSLTAPPVDDLLTALLDLKSKSFGDEARGSALAAREPAATVTVKLSAAGEPPWVLKLYPAGPQSEASVSVRPGTFFLSSDPIPGLEAAFQKAGTPPTPATTPSPAPKATAQPPTPKK
jgi:uncharacterized protein DUF4340